MGLHNHPPSPLTAAALSTHQCHRGLTDDIRDTIQEMTLNTSAQPRIIYQQLRKEHPGVVFTPKDVKDYRHRIIHNRQGSYTPTQTLIFELKEQKINHIVRWDKADS